MTDVLPKLLATSVVRGSEKGQSHGGVYLIDFESQQVEQKIDWNTGDIDFSGRGWDRGLRGIEFTEDAIWIAASDELFCYSTDFVQLASYRNEYLRHCHEICRRDSLLFLTSTGFDSILAFDLRKKEFVWGLYVSKNGTQWVGQPFDPRNRGGPAFVNSYHLNMIRVDQDGICFSGLNTQALLAVSSDMAISEICNLPKGCHNAMPHQGGILLNDTAADAVRYASRDGKAVVIGGREERQSADVVEMGVGEEQVEGARRRHRVLVRLRRRLLVARRPQRPRLLVALAPGVLHEDPLALVPALDGLVRVEARRRALGVDGHLLLLLVAPGPVQGLLALVAGPVAAHGVEDALRVLDELVLGHEAVAVVEPRGRLREREGKQIVLVFQKNARDLLVVDDVRVLLVLLVLGQAVEVDRDCGCKRQPRADERQL